MGATDGPLVLGEAREIEPTAKGPDSRALFLGGGIVAAPDDVNYRDEDAAFYTLSAPMVGNLRRRAAEAMAAGGPGGEITLTARQLAILLARHERGNDAPLLWQSRRVADILTGR